MGMDCLANTESAGSATDTAGATGTHLWTRGYTCLRDRNAYDSLHASGARSSNRVYEP
jgi:hypothetical protein